MERKETLEIPDVDAFITLIVKTSGLEKTALKSSLIEGEFEFTLDAVLDRVGKLTTSSGLSAKTRDLIAKLEEVSRFLTQTKEQRREELDAKLSRAFSNQKVRQTIAGQKRDLNALSSRLESAINKQLADKKHRLGHKGVDLKQRWQEYTTRIPSAQKRLKQPGYSKLVIGTIENVFSGTTKNPARFTDPFLVNRGITKEPIHTLEQIARAQ